MLVPQFSLQQTEETVQVKIRLPYVKVTSSQFDISSNNFKFYLKPYLLSLEFEQQLRDTQIPHKLQYNQDNHILTVSLLKQTKGQHFTKLDILPTLLIGSKSSKKPKDLSRVQIIAQKSEIAFDTTLNSNQFSYGFCNNYENIFVDLEEQAAELFDFSPQNVGQSQRLPLSRQTTQQSFDIESFLYDQFENPEIDEVLNVKFTLQLQFNELLKIQPRHLLVPKQLIKPTVYQMINICYCFTYEMICMMGELGPESGKTINMTSTVLSCNVDFQNSTLNQVIVQGMRRCMTFSLYKCLKVARAALNLLMPLNKQYILKVLTTLHQIYSQSDVRHLLNRLYISDYIVFLQQTDKLVDQVIQQLRKVEITTDDIGLGLKQLMEQYGE